MKIEAKRVQSGLQRIPQIKNTLAVASGKGGVGKSTSAVNLALSLQLEGARVGLLDADIYGPNQPTMLGVCMRPEETADKKLKPIISHGLPSMSIAYLIGPDTPMIWRGPMVSKALQQLIYDTDWPELDFLIIDLPPGTGDVQLTLAQRIPLTAAVIVTTPQEVACQDARKAIAMFEKVNIPILGVIENMKVHVCTQCGHQENLFGAGGGQSMADKYHIPYLQGIPFMTEIRDLADKGIPIVAKDPNSAIAQIYREAARKLVDQLNLQGKDYSNKFGAIKVE